MLHLGVEFGAQQDDDRGNPHEADDRAQRAVGLVELLELDAYQKNSAEIPSHRMAALPQVIHRHRGASQLGP